MASSMEDITTPWVQVQDEKVSSHALRRQKLKNSDWDTLDIANESFSSAGSDSFSSFSSEDLGYGTNNEDATWETLHEDVGVLRRRKDAGAGKRTRKSNMFCRSCSSVVIEEDLVEEPMNQTKAVIFEEDEDDVDGQARVYKVIQRCRCRESIIDKMENSIGKRALHPTKIMEKYQRSQSPLPRPTAEETDSVEKISVLLVECLKSQLEDVSKHLQSETEVYISDGSSTGLVASSVSIGLIVTSLTDETDLLRHFVGKEPLSGSPAADMGLKEGDELLLLNDKVLVGIDVDEMINLFADVKTDVEFTLFTRRKETNGSTYEYWQITTIIILKEEDDLIVPQVAKMQRAIRQNGDIIAPVDAEVQNVYIRTEQGYMKNVNGKVKIGELRTDETHCRFELLQYYGYVVENNRPSKKRLCLIRYSQDTAIGYPPYFLYFDSDNKLKVEFKAAPRDLMEPKKEDLENGTSSDGFSVKNAVFVRYPVDQNPDTDEIWTSRAYLESYKQRGSYLILNTNIHLVTMAQAEKEGLPYMNHAKFDISES